MAMLHVGKAYSDDLRWRIVWNRNFRRMTVSDVASEMLVSERTMNSNLASSLLCIGRCLIFLCADVYKS